MEKRCVITGIGAITPIGNDCQSYWENLKQGVCGIDKIQKFDTEGYRVHIAGEVKDFKAEDYVAKKEVKRMDYFTIYGIAAALQAYEMAGLSEGDLIPERFGVSVGSGIGGLWNMETQIVRLHEKGADRVSPLFIPMVIGNMAAGNIALRLGARGSCESIVTACATGTSSIGAAFRNIKHGYLDAALAGGTEYSVTPIALAGFANLTALSTCEDPKKACRPFDKNRDGFVMGDGAGVLLLEELEHALARGAKIYGEIVGYGASCDAYHMTAPSPDGSGAALAMQQAMQEAGISPADVGYINAHGTSTPANDAGETAAIKLAMGDAAYQIPISSTKSMTGHLLGAAGAIEAIAAIKALEEGFLPPTIGYAEPDPECDLDYIPNVGRAASPRYALSNSLGFGGHNAVLCFKRWEG